MIRKTIHGLLCIALLAFCVLACPADNYSVNFIGSLYLLDKKPLQASRLPPQSRNQLAEALSDFPITRDTVLLVVKMRIQNTKTQARVEKEMFFPYSILKGRKDSDQLYVFLWRNACRITILPAHLETFHEGIQRLTKKFKLKE